MRGIKGQKEQRAGSVILWGRRLEKKGVWMSGLITMLLMAAALLAFWLWCIAPRMEKQSALNEIKRYDYAHRGLHDNAKGIPENSLMAFRLAAESGFGMELDLQLTKDGRLVVHHDDNLKRSCGEDVRILDLTYEELQAYTIFGTEEHIPLFEEALAAIGRRTPVVVEIKAYTKAEEICPAVWEILKEYRGSYCIESFDPRAVRWFREHQPLVIRGQLMQKYQKGDHGLNMWTAFFASYMFTNCYTRPDFEAYDFNGRNNLSLTVSRKLLGMQEVSWTIRNWKDYRLVKNSGGICIFEGFEPFREPDRAAVPLEKLDKRLDNGKEAGSVPSPVRCEKSE